MPGGVYNFQGCSSFTDSLIGTARREGRFGASPTPPAHLSRRTDRRNGDERCTGRMERRRPDGRTMLDGRHLRTSWVAAPQCQPTNADSRLGHIPTTLTNGPAGLPHPTTRALLPDTGAWTITRNCSIAQVKYTLYTNGAALSAVHFLLIHYRKPSCQPGYRLLHLVGVAAISFCKHVTCLQRKHS